MIALIGALNKHGVAIAADSAATTGNGHYDKVYNTATRFSHYQKFIPLELWSVEMRSIKAFPGI